MEIENSKQAIFNEIYEKLKTDLSSELLGDSFELGRHHLCRVFL